MGRRVKLLIGLAPLAAAVLAVLLLATCSNAFDIFKAVETEVKVANNKFLLINDISPEKNAVAVNPSSDIVIEFDRDLKESTIDETTILLTGGIADPNPSWVPDYTPETRTLRMQPVVVLQGPNQYLVTITKAVKGTDGSELQEEYVWSFQTREYPGGTVFFQSVSKDFSLSTSAPLTIFLNDKVTHYKYALINQGDDPTEALSIAWTVNPNSGIDSTLYPTGTIPSGDGFKRVYLQVREEVLVGDDNIPEPVYDWTFLDTNNPTVSIDSGPTSVNASSDATQTYTASALDGSGSGFDDEDGYADNYAWTIQSLSGSGALTLTDSSGALSTSVYDNGTSADGVFRLTITVTDEAGRSNSPAVYRDVSWDRTVPLSSSISGPYYDIDPPLTWTWTNSTPDLASYEYSYNNVTFYNIGTSTSMNLNPAADDFGPKTLYLRAIDDAGNKSSTSSRTIYYSPGDIRPYWGERNVPVDGFTFQWPDYPGITPPYYYDFYIYPEKSSPPKLPVVADLKVSEFAVPAKSGYLDRRTQYNWFVRVYYIFKLKKTYVYTSPTFTFWTALF